VGQVPRNLVAELQSKLELSRAVETGTWRGEGARRLAAVFPEVVTIELSPELHEAARHVLTTNSHVRLLHGQSPAVLRELVDGTPTLYWLDAHWSHGDTAGQDDQCPLLEEIAAISGGSTPTDCILIDDARYFLATPERPLDPAQWPTIWDVFEALCFAWPDHRVTVAHDIVVAVPPQARDVADHFAHESIGHYWPLHRRAPRRALAQMLAGLEREGQ
jgi:hypothetical protein